MHIKETELSGVYLIEPEQFTDERGIFTRAWSETELKAAGIVDCFIEANLSYNYRRGTLRGLHWQTAPHGQAKLIRCTRGAIFDVGVDIRPDSQTYRQWMGLELSAENRLMLYLPTGFAHGYLTLADDSEVLYLVTNGHVPESGRGARWNDPAFGIRWPQVDDLIINQRDKNYPDFRP